MARTEMEIRKNIKTGEIQWPNQARCPHTDQFKDLVENLLMKDPEERLGHEGGADEILRHEWFSDIDITQIQARAIETPGFKPPAFSVEASSKYFNLKTGSNH